MPVTSRSSLCARSSTARPTRCSPMDSRSRLCWRPAQENVLEWRLPDTGGQPHPVDRRFACDRPAGLRMARSCSTGCAGTGRRTCGCDGRRAKAISGGAPGSTRSSYFATHFPPAFRISQDRGEGMLIHGGRQWRDYRVETTLTVHLAEYAGVGRARSGIAALLRGAARAAEHAASGSRARRRRRRCLPKRPSPGRLRDPMRFVVEVVGTTIEVSVDDVGFARAATKARARFADGGVALIIAGGAASTDEVIHVAPPRARAVWSARMAGR